MQSLQLFNVRVGLKRRRGSSHGRRIGSTKLLCCDLCAKMCSVGDRDRDWHHAMVFVRLRTIQLCLCHCLMVYLVLVPDSLINGQMGLSRGNDREPTASAPMVAKVVLQLANVLLCFSVRLQSSVYSNIVGNATLISTDGDPGTATLIEQPFLVRARHSAWSRLENTLSILVSRCLVAESVGTSVPGCWSLQVEELATHRNLKLVLFRRPLESLTVRVQRCHEVWQARVISGRLCSWRMLVNIGRSFICGGFSASFVHSPLLLEQHEVFVLH